VTDTPVNYVGLGGNLYAAGLDPTGGTEAALRHVANVHLWNAVRESGGAYGAPVRFDPFSGVVTLLSYRDPHLARTLSAFRAASGFLCQPLSERDLRGSIIAAIGARDRPLAPGDAASRALRRHLTGEDQVWRAQRRAEILATDRQPFLRLAEALAAMEERVVAIGGTAALEAMPPGTVRSRII
jgi:presequence protease